MSQPKLGASEGRGTERPWWTTGAVRVGLVVAAVFAAYWPCLQGDFVWDDDAWTRQLQGAGLFEGFSGLGAIWTRLTALQQYYPLTATTFWLDYQLWEYWTVPYHVENVLLHLLAAWLFWKLLRRLEVPGAWLATAILGLHPLMVESVAWITERKNVLALALFLGAALAYGRFTNFWATGTAYRLRKGATKGGGLGIHLSGHPGAAAGPSDIATERHHEQGLWGAYAWALLLSAAAYLAKATTFAFPAMLLLVCWWKRGRLRWREDVPPTLPFFAVSLGLGLVTCWLERNHVGARGPDWDIPFAGRCLIAGRALWFYVGKLLWPAELCFIYPRWELDTRSAANWLWPVAALAALAALWLLRGRIGRGPLAAALFYAGTLFPLLGFMNGYFMRYSFVCDHWSYLPSLGLITAGAALAARLGEYRPRLTYGLGVMVLTALAVLTFQQSAMYRDAETLYRTTLARNPKADLAHNNLGLLLVRAKQWDEAIGHFARAVELRPTSAHAQNNLANALRLTGRMREAASHYEASLKLEPDNASTCNNLALLLAASSDASLRNGARAVELARHANQLTGGGNPAVLGILAMAYAECGHFTEAAATARKALQFATQRPGSQLVENLLTQLRLYEAGQPFHEAAGTSL